MNYMKVKNLCNYLEINNIKKTCLPRRTLGGRFLSILKYSIERGMF